MFDQQKPLIINMLGFLEDLNLRLQGPRDDKAEVVLTPRILNDLRASGIAAVNVTLQYAFGPAEPFETSVADISRWNRAIARYPEALLKVSTTADIVSARESGRVGVIMGFQNAAMMGNDVARVDLFAGLGVKIIQLTYNGRNQVGDGSAVEDDRGLSSFGRAVVARLNETRTLIDLSHSSERTCLDATAESKAPVAITHTGCRALNDIPRNKSDAELRAVADKGGFVGIYFMPFLKHDSFPDAGDVVRHIEHAIDVCGEDHVGLGTDGSMTPVDDLEAIRTMFSEEVKQRAAAGASAKGEIPGVVTFLPDMQGPGQFEQLASLLAKRGHTARRIDKILGLNALNVLRAAWGA